MLCPLLVNLSFIFSQPTGISTYAINLFPHLQPLEPTLLTAQNFPNYRCYPVPSDLTPAQGSKGHFRRLLWTQRQLPEIYKKLNSSLIFSPVPEAPLYAGCRSVVMVHDLIPLRFPKRFSPLTPYFRYYIPQVLAQAEHIICNSSSTAQDIIDFFHIPEYKITPIHLAYDVNHFRFLNIPRSSYFLYIGRQDPYKNIARLINAFATLPSCRDNELWIAGSGDKRYTPVLMAQVEQLGIKNQVKFLDYVSYEELPTLINQAIALVFPSLWEGFGLPVLEAMACGTPVITSNLSSLPEVAGDAALLVNPYNVGEIAEAMQAVVTDSGWRSRLRQASLARASQFSWTKTGQATAQVLQRYL
ncbi:glycosyltransferase family 1 protein [Coleofasciculus sp. FACHB-542]|uniref:glycosyltransferase family 4 protein n=1 Tax=Coleofasciculus sp. FACHB-542 TaxID=2692787 RepID=UPI00168598F5|nr:glycosyltransferase family 1 protein [Coleofasciculus sp. FACHB-542]MBD2083705.1 glycosyltransferase family 4 protein [Coleofasciculus sp. FACHB-542]